jgi:DNA-binding NarL/FixJ family response regulator
MNINRNLDSREIIRIAILEDQALARIGLEALIKSQDDFELAGSFSEPELLFEFLTSQTVDLITVDLYLKGDNIFKDYPPIGIQTLETLKNDFPKIKVLVITGYPNVNNFKKCIDLDVKGFIIKDEYINQYPTLTEIIRIIAAGKVYYESSLVPLINRIPHDEIYYDDSYPKKELTSSELKVLKSLVKNQKNAGIAKELNLSEATIKTHLSNIYRKMGVNNRTEAIQFAIRNGLLNN